MESLALIKSLPTIFGNVALDCLFILITLLITYRYFLSATKSVTAITRKRQRANTLRKTLELKAEEVSALRRALSGARLNTESLISPYQEELKARELWAHIASKREHLAEHEELEQRLDQAAQKHPRSH